MTIPAMLSPSLSSAHSHNPACFSEGLRVDLAVDMHVVSEIFRQGLKMSIQLSATKKSKAKIWDCICFTLVSHSCHLKDELMQEQLSDSF